MDFRRYTAIARRWWWLLVLGAVAGFIAAYAFSRSQEPIYSASATMLINQAQAASGTTYNDVLANQQLSKTYANLAKRRPVLEQVETNLGLTPGALNGRVSTNLLRETQLIEAHVEHPNPEIAAAAANEITKVFSQQIREAQGAEQITAEQDLDNQIKAVQASIDTATNELNNLNRPVTGMTEDQRQGQISQLNGRLDSLRNTQVALQRQLQDVRISQIRSFNSVKLVESATPPEAPVRPRKLLNGLLGTALGIGAAVVLISVLEYLDDTIKTPSDVRTATNLPVVGAIGRFDSPPKRRRSGQRGLAPNLLTELDSRAPIAESYRVIRTNLEYAHSDGPYHTMLVTSATPSEGKTTTAANLSLVLAQTGRRVILVDADMRRPSVHRLFELPNTSGLSTLFVMDEPEVNAVLRPTLLDNLYVLPCGPLPPNPAELLSSLRMRQIIDLLKIHADFIVFDSPPILGVADASALAPRLDGAIIVVEAGSTRRNVLTSTVDALRQVNANLWGVVLNKVVARNSDEYLAYGYQYYQDEDSGPPGTGLQPAQPAVGRPWRSPGAGG